MSRYFKHSRENEITMGNDFVLVKFCMNNDIYFAGRVENVNCNFDVPTSARKMSTLHFFLQGHKKNISQIESWEIIHTILLIKICKKHNILAPNLFWCCPN